MSVTMEGETSRKEAEVSAEFWGGEGYGNCPSNEGMMRGMSVDSEESRENWNSKFGYAKEGVDGREEIM